MPSVLNLAAPNSSPSTPRSPQMPKKKFRTVLGFGSLDSRPRSPPTQSDDDDDQPVLITTGPDSRRKPSVTDQSLFAQPQNSANSPPSTPRSATSSLDVEEMKIDLSAVPTIPTGQHAPPMRSNSKPNFRLTSQWGPWTISVAETPHDPQVYNIYIKTPTHNITLTRSQNEVIEMHTKLRDSFPTATLPPFPLATNVTASPSNKRRSSFLHTLTRLTNSTNAASSKLTKTSRPASAHGPGSPLVPSASFASITSPPASYPTPLHSPPAEQIPDPFSAVDTSFLQGPDFEIPASGSTTTALAAYLTTVSNDPKLRTSRVWKRFVRVRSEDLQSVRVERAIKRVRSDVAMHTSPSMSAGIPSANNFANAPSISSRLEADTPPAMLSFGLNFGAGSLGLSPEGGFQSEVEAELETTSETPSKSTSNADVSQKPEDKENRLVVETTSQVVPQMPSPVVPSPTIDNKRVSSVIAMPSAFSSDSALAETVAHAVHGATGSLGSAPPTPTPATAELPAPAMLDPQPEEVELPPSPLQDKAEEHPATQPQAQDQRTVVSGLLTPIHSPQPNHAQVPSSATITASSSHAAAAAKIPRSKSADPDKASWRLKSSLGRELLTSDSFDGDGSVADAGEAGEATTDADAKSVTTNDGDVSRDASRKRTKKKVKKPAKKVCVDDFDMLRVLGKGCAGKVLLVKYKKTGDLYALKAITKRHVLAHQELQHTLTEQAVLKRMSREGKDPFVVKLWWSFHDKDNLFLVMDFHPGGDLATQLARWGRLGRDRARFYAAEIVEGVEGLHNSGVIYRDLKPENILIGSDGHIVLTDFGLSKEFPRRYNNGSGNVSGLPSGAATPNGSNGFDEDFYAGSSAPGTPGQVLPHWMNGSAAEDGAGGLQAPWSSARDVTSTFCGTAEYLAPEVIQGLPYSYEVDWWSFGTMLYEMLSGITPFWANNHSDMYVRVLQDELQFPDDRAMDQDTKSLIRGLLQRNPALRMSEPRVKRHPYFSMIDWDHVYYKRYIPPYIPPIDPSNASDTQNFDETFLEMVPVIDNDEEGASDSEHEKTEDDGAKTDGEESVKKATPSEPVAAVVSEKDAVEVAKDVFDGYSFKGRNSVLIDDEDDEGYADEEHEEDDGEELVEARKVTDALAAMHPQANGVDVITEAHTKAQVLLDIPVEAIREEAVEEPAVPKEDEESQEPAQQGNETALTATPSTSTPPESIVTASISTEPESVAAPKAPKEPTPSSSTTVTITKVTPVPSATPSKQNSAMSEMTSTLPSLATGRSTAVTTPTDDLTDSPLVAPDSPLARSAAAAAKIAEGVIMFDDVPAVALAPLQLSPVIEAVDPSGAVVEEEALPPVDGVKIVTPRVNPVPLDVDVRTTPTIQAPITPVQNPRSRPNRREKSGIPALDRGRRDEDDATEREEEDWDLVETPHGHEDRNGAKGLSLWQRGVVDRYRLAVFRKSTNDKSRIPRSVSGTTLDSSADAGASPSPSGSKHRRGRTGISLRKSTRELLRAKSPSATVSAQSSAASRVSLAQQGTATLSVNSAGLLTPSPSVPARPIPSLKSKSSALSKTSAGSPPSSDQSVTDLRGVTSPMRATKRLVKEHAKSPTRASPGEETPDRPSGSGLKKMKKYTEQRAEKMLSLFGGSPRHHQQHPQPPPTPQQ